MVVLIGISVVVHNAGVQLVFAVSVDAGIFAVGDVALDILVVQDDLQQPDVVERLVYVPLDDVLLLFAAKRLAFALLDDVVQLDVVGLFVAGYFHDVSAVMPLEGADLFVKCSDYSQRVYRGR